ncbi:ABC-2 type transport system ATP-binding protein [Sinosporangium album]|uniref:ABC-2 type transport system ATP-binding protein n=1 Tax=Sinosporangium album TaxID=504805 RepID=A0A1G7W6K0_9ACTN|nr:ABC transporter ATP-binding protein [Sinosporangium album]SDG67573.1 ABC-2 type transport system ATP-binding protein [Sinosporangium album]
MTATVEVRGLGVRYRDVQALSDVTLTLHGGKIYGLLGRNGSGKTSLLSTMAGFLRPTAGTVLIDGEQVFENPRAMRRVCLIRQTADVLDRFVTVRDVLEFGTQLRAGWDADYADRLIERFEVPRKHMTDLSRGQLSALGIVIGLASRAPLTIFDESYLGMDAPARAAFQDELLSDFMDTPRTIVLSTHLIEELGSLFEEVLIIDRGRLLLHDEADALRGRGMSVTGPAPDVDAFVGDCEGLAVLGQKQLGPTKSAILYGGLAGEHRDKARAAGLDLGPIPLQELFTHLTRPSGELA